jgi:hypothetical protein
MNDSQKYAIYINVPFATMLLKLIGLIMRRYQLLVLTVFLMEQFFLYGVKKSIGLKGD